jgi:hypothetical protein
VNLNLDRIRLNLFQTRFKLTITIMIRTRLHEFDSGVLQPRIFMVLANNSNRHQKYAFIFCGGRLKQLAQKMGIFCAGC